MSKFIVLFYLFIFISGFVSSDSNCGDWTSYRDEKCFKVIDILRTFSGAEQVCEKEGANIGIIRSAEEQDIVVANLQNESIVDNVWIGIKKNGKSFVSLDGNALKYTNWANGRPLNQTDVDCVEISEDVQDKWLDVKCEKKNAVLCEKSQQWNNSKIEDVLTQIRKIYSERMDLLEANLTKNLGLIEAQKKEIDKSRMELDKLKQNQTISRNLIETQRKDLDNLKQNPLPVNFIYVQLSGQSEPHTLWPQTEWSDISTKYAGLFFRAQGGGSSSFGETQSEQMPTLKYQNGACSSHPSGCDLNGHHTEESAISVTKKFSKLYYTGTAVKGDHNGANFKFTTDEIRPRNQAIRIWIRI